MHNPIPSTEFIGRLLKDCCLAVLATEGKGQPHASLIAITAVNFRQIIFATYTNTRKFENLKFNSRVAVLIQGEDKDSTGQNKKFALTAFGHASEVRKSEREKLVNEHIKRHPDLANLTGSSDLALFRIQVEAYQIVHGIDDVSWLNVEDAGC
ncbi:MAG: pyridoxamine 5'-phosphate oxidase family protein [Bacteroidales bacterium]|nr:pyridoxamine 5'-phosphate oxidase family protein [Bacteroidales bacterium]